MKTKTAYLQARRQKLLDKRGRERVHGLINRFAIHRAYTCMTDDDGNETDINIEVRIDAANLELAASEFRACGFVVSKQ